MVGELEPAIRSVTVIPGATEFGYDPMPRVRVLGPGATASENAHQSPRCSRLDAVARRADGALPQPRACVAGGGLVRRRSALRPLHDAAEGRGGERGTVRGTEWSVAGLSRGARRWCRAHDGGPAYGGTPSDAAVLAAIADLKARGLAVTLYPMLLMDIPGRATRMGQPAYPWRGRISCAGAGRRDAGTARRRLRWRLSASDWGYRRMVLHYAHWPARPGRDALVIGSEMRGLTTVREAAAAFRSSTALVTLAAEVRAIVGAGRGADLCGRLERVSRAVSRPMRRATSSSTSIRSGRRADIDAVGIDNYMPLTDWRDGEAHADAAAGTGRMTLDYLDGQYRRRRGLRLVLCLATPTGWPECGRRSPMARMASPGCGGSRTSPGWWSNAHHDRIGGVRSAIADGLGAGDQADLVHRTRAAGRSTRAPTSPTCFRDAKSAEGGRPYFSTGAPDALMQRQVLRAHLQHWAERQPIRGMVGCWSGSICGPGMRGPIRPFRRRARSGRMAPTTRPGTG